MGIEIREAREEELQEIAEMCWREIHDELLVEWVFEWLKSYKEPFSKFYVAIEDSKLVGFICWSLYDRYGKQVVLEISFLAVKQTHQRKEVGQQLVLDSLERIKKRWQEEGCETTMIMVETEEDNKGACDFYRVVLRPTQEVLVPKVWHHGEGKTLFFKKIGSG